MKLFGNSLDKLFTSRSEIIKNQLSKEIKTIEDLESLYIELGYDTDKSSDRFKDLVDTEGQENYDYWEDTADPVKGRTSDVYEAENLSSEDGDGTEYLDNAGLAFIMGKHDRGYEDEDPEAPVIENENRHTPRKDLKPKDLERQQKLEAGYKEVRENPEGAKEVPTDLPIEVTEEKVVVEAEVKTPAPVERVKPEVKVELERAPKPLTEIEKFKLMKEVLTYNLLVMNNPDLEKLQPKRGDVSLSVEQVREEIKAFEAKKEKEADVSPLEEKYYEDCKAWMWAVDSVEEFKNGAPKNAEGQVLSKEERAELQKEYVALRYGDKDKFDKLTGRLSFENFGNNQVEKGEWKKAEFAWKKETQSSGITIWYDFKEGGKDMYYTVTNPSPILENNESAEFFYTVNKETDLPKGKKYFIAIKVPVQQPVKKPELVK